MTDPGAGAAHYRAFRELVTPQRLREFFAPRSIALVVHWFTSLTMRASATRSSGPN